MGDRIHRRMRGRRLVWLWWPLMVAGGLWAGGMAAGAAGTAGFGVSPAFGQLVVQADQPRVEYSFKLTNRNSVDQRFRLSTVDFGSLDEEGGVAFLGQPTHELEHKYGLASWMKLQTDAVTVPAGKTVPLGVVIENRESLAPGGHYGAILATAVTEAGVPVRDGVGIKQVVSSLILLTKAGGADVQLDLAGQVLGAGFWRLPTAIEHRFHNTGNVHATPRGTVTIRDPWGRTVARTALNEASGAVLPDSFRRYRAGFTQLAPAWMPGRYEVKTVYRADGSNDVKTAVVWVWYAGALVVWIVGLLALLAVAVLVWWLWWRPQRARRFKT